MGNHIGQRTEATLTTFEVKEVHQIAAAAEIDVVPANIERRCAMAVVERDVRYLREKPPAFSLAAR
ncbi:MAG: hypothetical protein ACLQUT_06880, partial [Thermoleophilia bacterium]